MKIEPNHENGYAVATGWFSPRIYAMKISTRSRNPSVLDFKYCKEIYHRLFGGWRRDNADAGSARFHIGHYATYFSEN